MRKVTIFKKVVAGIGSAALAIALTACAHHDASAEGYGQIRTEAAATTAADSNTEVVAVVAAPANANMGGSTTPAVISGPAAVDSDGRAYTSSSAGGTGNASNLGTNTNVNLIPKKVSSDVIVTQSPVETTTTVVSNSPAPIVPMTTESQVVIETPAPTPIVVETPAIETPMASSTTEDQTTTTTTTETPRKHHRKMHKD